jgi:predicted nucleic acid-binding Zn ribbon protein
MDVFDQATEMEERDRDAAIAAQRNKTAVLPDIGHCHSCEEPRSDGRRFCDADCRDDYDREQKHRKRQGR